VSKKRYFIFTNDENVALKVSGAFSPGQCQTVKESDLPIVEKDTRLVIIDGDFLPLEKSGTHLKRFKRLKVPVVFIVSELDGKAVMELLNSGIISVLFKDYTLERIKHEVDDILSNFHYLEKVKDIAENDNRTKRFLRVVNSLTSDNDINKIMNEILASMLEVFKLESTVFFIVKHNRLKYKLELGKCRRVFSNSNWALDSPDVHWLNEIRQSRKPLRITSRSRQDYKRYFPENTTLLPLVIKDRFIGLIIATLPPHAKKLSRNEIALLMAFAEQTAVALENARLYWDVIKTREQLVKQEKNDLLNQTIISLNHEINNPLSIISMETQLLQQRLHNTENKIENRIAKIDKNIERIKSILEKISSLSVEDISITDYIQGKRMLNLLDH
jgi:response regulator of citrate/malate metabolism